MAKIIKNGVTYSDTGAMVASGVTYNNTSSGLSATNAQSAIDETVSNLDAVSSRVDNLIAVTKSYTIGSSDWDEEDKTYTINDQLITTGTNESTQTIGYNPNLYNDNLYKELCNASIRISNVSNGSITLKCMGELPTDTLPITVTFCVGAQPVELTVDSVPTSGSNNAISSDGVYNSVNQQTIIDTTYSGLGQYHWSDVNDTTFDFTDSAAPKVNLISKGGWNFLSVDLKCSVALTSGTSYNIINDVSDFLSIIGRTYVIGMGGTTSGQMVAFFISTDKDGETPIISIKPRAAVEATRRINCAIAFPKVV